MRTFAINVDIQAAPERVWAVMSDVERWSEWTASIKSIRRLDKGPFQIGSRAWIRQPKLPPALWKVSELQNGRSFTWVSGSPGIRVLGTHSVEPTPTGSRATLSIHFDGVLGGLLGRLLRGLNEQYLAWEAAGLKRRSENR
ncbi:MAG TPA: SRPBCC family protein [Vicinamibacterales bacterium]|jgi:hypothetical protein|nr:SRPBCC family protein [Vicinamibacterales bacterium]